jgi:aryl-alcohol dehydrogenase-like predicted oxidoreductase
MRYKLLGRSGLRVSELCLGTMTFGDDWAWGADKETSKKMFDMYADAGGNFIDTANLYTNGTSEKFVGEFVKSERDAFVVATKYTLTPTPNQGLEEHSPNRVGNHRKNMMQAVERSLKRLDTEYIDILYVHAWDYTTPVEEVMRAMDDLVRQGKVFYVAASDTPSWIMAEANTRAELMGWSRFIGIQAPYSLLSRDLERAILPMARKHEMAVLPWGILNGGILSGKFLNAVDKDTRVNPDTMKDMSEERLAIVHEVVNIAEEIGKAPAQVAINWVRQGQHRAQMIPIIGSRRVEQMQDNLDCLEWELAQEQLDRLDKVSSIKLGFPFEFTYRNKYVYGETFDTLDIPAHLRQVPTIRHEAQEK